MKPRDAKASAKRLSVRSWSSLFVVLGAALAAAVLLPGFELATELADSTTALKFVAQQQRNADLVRVSLDSLSDRLASRGFIEPPIKRLRASVKSFDAALRELDQAQPSTLLTSLRNDTGSLGVPALLTHAAVIEGIWRKQRQLLEPVLDVDGIPYRDSETTGTELNDKGRKLAEYLESAIPATRHSLALLDTELTQVGAELQANNARAATDLRIIMLTGILVGALLVFGLAVLLSARGKQERNLREARRQTEDILRNVKEGLFLLDRELVIGAAYSAALPKMFQRQDLAGLAFEDLLKPIVSERTLGTASKYVKLLWTERTKENLIKSINPLGEVEVRLDGGQGGFETRYLEFDFHRVRVDDAVTNILVSVSDVTARVNLALELKASQSQAQGQVDTLLGILHVEPGQLASFLADSNASMKMINAVLREPAREESVFRKKLDTLFRQAHSVKGEAAALGLSSIETRAHAFEDDLKALREKPGLSGNDFLPLVIKLDDLLTHLQSVSDLVARFSRYQVASSNEVHAATTNIDKPRFPAVEPDQGAVAMLGKLVERVAGENQKNATLQCLGFEAIPEHYRRLVKDIAVQGIRNAIVHGIETPDGRAAAGKSHQGIVRLEFQELGSAGYRFTIEDDGKGMSTEHIKETAVAKGFLSAAEAASLDPKQTFALLFRSGFSTVETATLDAGRGVGMNVIAELLREVGGRVAVSTQPGKFTRLTLTLPQSMKQSDDIEAA